jgi:hypothetical protein
MLSAAILVAAYLVLLYGPGIALGRLLRVRGIITIAAAPALTYGVIGIATPALGKLGIRWNLGTAAAVLALALVVAWLIGRLLRAWEQRRTVPAEGPGAAHVTFFERTDEDTAPIELPAGSGFHRLLRADALIVAAGILAGGVLGLVTVLKGMGGTLDAVHQGWDPAWHANYTQWITDTGDASPLHAGRYLNWSSGVPLYYPSAIHGLGSLVEQLTGQSTVRIVNADMLLMAGLLVPLGAAALTWLVSRRNVMATAIAAAVSTWFTIYPSDEVWRTALPFALGLGLLGPVLVLTTSAVAKRPQLVVAAGLATAGLASVHTSLAFCVAGFAVLWLLVRSLRLHKARLRELGWLAVVGALAGLVLLPQLRAILAAANQVASFDWSQHVSTAEALRQVFGFGFGEHTSDTFHDPQAGQYVLAALVAIGAVVALRYRRTAWLALTYLVFGLLAVHASVPHWKLIGKLTTPWYNDPWRIAAIACVAAVPLVGIGIARLVTLLPTSGRVHAAVATGLAVVLFVVTGFGYVERNSHRITLAYNQQVIDSQELGALHELRSVTGGQGRILNDPYDGSVWMYSVDHVLPVFTHYDVGTLSRDEIELWSNLNQWQTRPEVREAAHRLGVRYLYLQTGEIYSTTAQPVGYTGIEAVPGFRVVLDRGPAKLYELPAD